MKVYAYNAVRRLPNSEGYQKNGWYLSSHEPNVNRHYCYYGNNLTGFLADDDPDICAFLDNLIGDISNTEYREIEL